MSASVKNAAHMRKKPKDSPCINVFVKFGNEFLTGNQLLTDQIACLAAIYIVIDLRTTNSCVHGCLLASAFLAKPVDFSRPCVVLLFVNLCILKQLHNMCLSDHRFCRGLLRSELVIP